MFISQIFLIFAPRFEKRCKFSINFLIKQVMKKKFFRNFDFSHRELVKSCYLSTGYDIYLFRLSTNSERFKYLVVVHHLDDVIEYCVFDNAFHANSLYTGFICSYA